MSQRKTRKGTKRSTPITKIANHSLRVASTKERNHLTALHRQGDFKLVRDLARQIVEAHPDDAFAWTALGSSLLKLSEYEEALQALNTANSLFPDDHLILDALARTHAWLGNHQKAIEVQRRCLELEPEHADGHFHLAALLNNEGNAQALEHLDIAEALGYDPVNVLLLRGSTQSALLQFNAALATYRKLLEIAPNDPLTLNDIANAHKDMGDFQRSEAAYRKALELNPEYATAYSNLFFTMHYDPNRTPESILAFAKEWEKRFTQSCSTPTPVETDRKPNKRLRVGLLSSGMRQHPVGQMITTALEHLDDSLELYAYSTNNIHDNISERIRKHVASWQTIGHLSAKKLADKIRQDKVDILIEMSGHGAGNRLQTIAMRPAPIVIKWVGGLIGSMGLTSFDYLLSDAIETPPGMDHLYVEKLIRMPDDYICYLPPDYLPAITLLPAIINNYVTLGCFNNPAKINPVLLAEWALLMHQLPNSRLLLKGAQYDSPEFCERIRSIMREHDIADERLILEGPANHQELLKAYNRVDIALDPWPYSGGLTTCEAMLMGVPVVTFPGPTFAGRHSATHLVNAGMPELVVDSWDEYRQRVIELATDLPNLSIIRACLRRVLIESPVCDGPRFARHFTTAMRAIWQRYCEGKVPAALSLDKDGSARFDGEDIPVTLMPQAQVPAEAPSTDATFHWGIEGKIITIDHGASLTNDPIFTELQKTGAFATITFDPTGKVKSVEQLQQSGELHHYPHVALGDGQPITLYSCSDPAMTATLEPLAAFKQPASDNLTSQVITCHAIPSLRMDDIDGLKNIDWIILDDLNDSLKIFEHAKKSVNNTLLIHARVGFIQKHHNQPELGKLTQWLSAHGFSFYRLNKLQHLSFMPKRSDLLKLQASQLASADALFLPDAERIASLDTNQRLKLAFLLHQVYGAHDLTAHLLSSIDQEKSEAYLKENGYLKSSEKTAQPNQLNIEPTDNEKGRFVHICFNNIHVQPLISLLKDNTASAEFTQQIFIEKSRSIKDYSVNIKDNKNAYLFDKNTQLKTVLESILRSDVIAIFFHGIFFDWQKELVASIGKSKKTIWVIWGGDLYNPIRQNKPIKHTVENLYAVSTITDGDYELFCKHYHKKPRFKFTYSANSDLREIAIPETKDKTIFVGNSGDPSNNHIEILEALSKKSDITDYDLIIPISYNLTPEYETQIKATISKLGLEKRTKLLKNIIPTTEYFTMLAKAEFLITAHHRQQALGNLSASLYFGNKTILRKMIKVNSLELENPAWQKLTCEIKANPIAYEDFLGKKNLGDIPFESRDELAIQQNEILASLGEESIKTLMHNQFLAIAAS